MRSRATKGIDSLDIAYELTSPQQMHVFVPQALTFVPGNETELVDMFKRWSIAYSKTLMCHLREEGDVKAELEVSHHYIPL